MLHYALPDIEQPEQMLRGLVILDGFNHLGEKVTLKLTVCRCLSDIVSHVATSACRLQIGGGEMICLCGVSACG